MRRVPEVADCWFDSGAMPVAQWHYPFENQETFAEQFPADLVCEAADQTHGWFYTLHAISTLLFDQPCYHNVIGLGLILDEQGQTMSRAHGNVVDPWEVLNAHGADALRWYLYTASPPGESRRLSAALVGEAARQSLLPLWNTFSLFVGYANMDGWEPGSAPSPETLRPLDRWILSELNRLIAEVTERLDQYDVDSAARAIATFVDDLSNWYVRRSHRRFRSPAGESASSDAAKEAAYHTLYTCLVTLSHLLAPFTPFMAEAIYQNLVRGAQKDTPESVHLARWPEADTALIDEVLMADVRLAQRVISLGHAARQAAQVKAHQPLAEAIVGLRMAEERPALERVADQIIEELNVKALRVAEVHIQPSPPYSVASEGGYSVAVNTALTPELVAEGDAPKSAPES
jgi:isoleucyl-tRNA synthetase